MYRTFLSLRYLRARRTNWIGTAGIFVAVTALILILSIMSGFLNEGREKLRGSLSDLIIQPALEVPVRGKELSTDPGPLLEIIRADPRVDAACVQLEWIGILTPPGKAHVLRDPTHSKLSLVSLIGIDVADEFTTTDLRNSLAAERMQLVDRVSDIDDPLALVPGDPDERPLPSILIGEQLAHAWALYRGDEVQIVTARLDDETGGLVDDPSNARFLFAGAFRSGENEADLSRVYIDRREVSDLLGENETYTSILVKLVDYERDKEAVVADLHSKLTEAGLLHSDPRFREIRTWEQFRETWLAAVENEKSLMGIMLSLILIVAGFTVFAILSMMVTEKRRDIGILTALGGTSRGIMSLFVLIGMWQALLGAFLGALCGVWAAINIDPIERWLSKTFGFEIFNREVYYFDHIPSVIEVRGIAMIVLGAFLCTLLFAAVPAWKASRLHPIDALRSE